MCRYIQSAEDVICSMRKAQALPLARRSNPTVKSNNTVVEVCLGDDTGNSEMKTLRGNLMEKSGFKYLVANLVLKGVCSGLAHGARSASAAQ